MISMAKMVFKCLEVNDATEMILIRTLLARSSLEIPRKYLENFSMVCHSKICFPVRPLYFLWSEIYWNKTYLRHTKRITIVSFQIPQVFTVVVLGEEVQIDIIIRLIIVSVLLSLGPLDSAFVYRLMIYWRTPVLLQISLPSVLLRVSTEWVVALPWNVPAPRLVSLMEKKLQPRSKLSGIFYLYYSRVHAYANAYTIKI